MQQPDPSSATYASDPSPSNLVALPLILLLGCDRETEAHCRAIASRARKLLRSAPLPILQSEIAAMGPLVIIVPANVYASDPWGLEALAEMVGASLLMLRPDPVSSMLLEYRVMKALTHAMRVRDRVRVRDAVEAPNARAVEDLGLAIVRDRAGP
jgi:hypothetical protein